MLVKLLLTAAVVLGAIQGSSAQDQEFRLCPFGIPMVECPVEPCSYTLCPVGTNCYSNFCGECKAVCIPENKAKYPGPSCPSGDRPLPNHYCGEGGKWCPPTMYCNIDPVARWAVCCPVKGVGQCPVIRVGVCVEACRSNDDCPGQLCCYNGCGHHCYNAAITPAPQPPDDDDDDEHLP
ncbi:uncharacterized protein LOC144867240 isoform X2 [Branchiostoma floridae x Branchiostoma japonicum]